MADPYNTWQAHAHAHTANQSSAVSTLNGNGTSAEAELLTPPKRLYEEAFQAGLRVPKAYRPAFLLSRIGERAEAFVTARLS